MGPPRFSPRIAIGIIAPVGLWFGSFQTEMGGLLRLGIYLLVIVAAVIAAIRYTGVWRAFWVTFAVVYAMHILALLFTGGADGPPPFRWTFELAYVFSMSVPWSFSWQATYESIAMIAMLGASAVAGLLSTALYRLEDKRQL